MTLEKGLFAFLDAMLGKNRSKATLRAYRTDVLQFIAFLALLTVLKKMDIRSVHAESRLKVAYL